MKPPRNTLSEKEKWYGIDCLPCHFQLRTGPSIWKETLIEDILSTPPHDCCCLFHQSTCMHYSQIVHRTARYRNWNS